MNRIRRTCAVVVVAAAFAALTGCGGEGDGPADTVVVVSEPGGGHIHGVGVDPADESVVIATHSGLYRAARGDPRAKRVGDRWQDTMGFTVVGPNRYLGSGHPDLRDDLPPLLGLIESRDAGRSWSPIALLGKTDFHVLRAALPRVYGVDSQSGQLFVTEDSGRTMKRRTPPPGVVDIAIDPTDSTRVLATAKEGLFVSADAGRRWRPIADASVGLLAWTDRVVLIDGAGDVRSSDDGGTSFKPVGSLGGKPAALASHENDLYVATHDNVIKRSTDGGRSWRKVATI